MKNRSQQIKKKRWWLFTDNNELALSWFNFVEWVVLTGALSYLKNRTNSQWVELFHSISLAALYLFVQSWVGKTLDLFLDVSGFFIKGKKLKVFLDILSAVLSLVLIALIYKMIGGVIDDIESNPI